MANLSNINNILRVSSSGVGINRDPLGAFEISSATKPGIKMFNTAASGKTYEAYSDTNGNYIIYDQDADDNRFVINSAGNSTFAGDVGLGGTGLYTTSHSLNIDGTGLAIKNNVSGSNNNWSHITNSATASTSNLVFTTGSAIALTLAHNTDATFGGSVNATSFNDGYVTWTAAQFNRYGAAIELQYTPTNAATLVKIGANGSNPTIFNAFTGDATFAGNISAPVLFLPDGGDIAWAGGYSSSKPVLAANGTTMKMYPSGVTSGVQFSLSPTSAFFAGNVGIGTSSPGSTLTLGNATGNVAELRVLRSNSLSTTYGFIGTVGGTVQLGGTGDTRITSVNGRLVFNSNNVDQISLEANGEYRLKLASTTAGYEASMDNSNTAYRIFGSRFGGTGKYVAIWSDGANENTRFYPTLTTFYKMVGMRTTSPYSVLDVNGVIANRAADADPNFTVAAVGMSTIEGGSLQFTQGFGGTSAAGDTVVFRYNAVSWKSWSLDYTFTAANAGLVKGTIGGYNNGGGGGSNGFVKNDTGCTVVATNSGQNVIVTFTANFGIHPMCDMRYSQGGGDGAPRADRASLTFNS